MYGPRSPIISFRNFSNNADLGVCGLVCAVLFQRECTLRKQRWSIFDLAILEPLYGAISDSVKAYFCGLFVACVCYELTNKRRIKNNSISQRKFVLRSCADRIGDQTMSGRDRATKSCVRGTGYKVQGTSYLLGTRCKVLGKRYKVPCTTYNCTYVHTVHAEHAVHNVHTVHTEHTVSTYRTFRAEIHSYLHT